MAEQDNKKMEYLVNHLKQYGFVFQGSEIYGGLSNTWDYGPLGAQMKRNLKNIWWNNFVSKNSLNVGLDSAIFMNSEVWKISGHLSNFHDLLVDCKNCHNRFRVDHLLDALKIDYQNLEFFALEELMKHKSVTCLHCHQNNFTDIRRFDLMFQTYQGVVKDSKNMIYLRPETAQGIFVNFKNVQQALRKKLPFGIAQMGKAFRNEITPGHFIFRTREFEQMELEFFYDPQDTNAIPTNSSDWFEYWLTYCESFLFKIGLKSENISRLQHAKEALAHYSKRTTDLMYNFPFGKQELWGIADRTDFDLRNHSKHSNIDLAILPTENKAKFYPHVIEPSVGVDRLLLALWNDALVTETLNEKDKRVVMKLHPQLAPYFVAILPLSKELKDATEILYNEILKDFNAVYDESQSIGKRYRRQDAIGTPYCITVDFKSMKDKKVTIRDRDTMQQKRIKIRKVVDYLKELQKEQVLTY